MLKVPLPPSLDLTIPHEAEFLFQTPILVLLESKIEKVSMVLVKYSQLVRKWYKVVFVATKKTKAGTNYLNELMNERTNERGSPRMHQRTHARMKE